MVTNIKPSRYIANPFECPVTRAMNIIGGKWKPIILFVIGENSLRFGRIRHFVPAISSKVLTQELKELEEYGLIGRQEFRESPPRVEYSLSKFGLTVLPVLEEVAKWGSSAPVKKFSRKLSV
jgi:DNA-binding HxlR family transcriptional regulator